MKVNILLTAMLVALPLQMVAQDDDMYFVPSKKQKADKTAQYDVRDAYAPAFDERAFEGSSEADYHVGKLRNTDEYNRRGHGHRYGMVVVNDSLKNDTLYIDDDKLYGEQEYEGIARQNEDDGYGYSRRLVRFHGGIRSPYYWDYYYDWAYDPWFYDSWYYDPWYYGGHWGGYYGWHSPYYYSSWHHYGYGWYDPWYYGGHWGGHYGVGHGYAGHVGGHGRSNFAHRDGTQGALYGGRSAVRGNANGTRMGGLGTMSRSRYGNNANTTTRTTRAYDNSTRSTTTRSRGESVTTQRSTRDYTPSRSESYSTPSRSSNSSGSFGGGSSSMRSSGGGFGGGSSSTRSSGGGGGGGSRGGGGGGRAGR